MSLIIKAGEANLPKAADVEMKTVQPLVDDGSR